MKQGTEQMKETGNEQPLVLAVDNDRSVLDEISAVLSQVKINCCCCTTSVEAIAAAQATPPNLVLCNVNLHGESGLEMCERIKQQPGLHALPLMFLSGVQLPDIVRRRCSAGSSYCLRKPFDPHVLVELIDQALGVPST